MNLEKIKEIVTKLLDLKGIELVSVKQKQEFGLKILEITVDKDNLDAAILGTLNEEINDAIDEFLPEDYYLEVSTRGAIRPIESLEQAQKYIDKYVIVETNEESYKGILKEATEIIKVQINLKGRLKMIELPYKALTKFELTVKW